VVRDHGGKVVAKCGRRKSAAENVYQDATYTLYFDLATRTVSRIVCVQSNTGTEILGFETQGAHLNTERAQVLVWAILVGERHEFNKSRPGGMSQMIEAIDGCLDNEEASHLGLISRFAGLSPRLGGSTKRIRIRFSTVCHPMAFLDGLAALGQSPMQRSRLVPRHQIGFLSVSFADSREVMMYQRMTYWDA
jgi:hypothetical protein